MTLEGPLFTTLETFPIAARGDRLFIGAYAYMWPSEVWTQWAISVTEAAKYSYNANPRICLVV